MIQYIIYGVLGFFLLWVFFVNVMTWKHNLHKIPHWLIKPLTVIGWIGYLYDIIYNLLFATVLFLDIPRELTLTARMKRLLNGKEGWRFKLALFICMKLVEPWDPDHCGLSKL